MLAGRLAGNLGARRLACSLHLRAWREDRGDAEALYYAAFALFERRGPLAAWDLLRDAGEPPGATSRARSDLFALRAELAATFRDFDSAESLLARAEEIGADPVWTGVVRARVMELEDRYAEALEAARASLAQRPWYRPAVQSAAQLLQLLDRDGEALDLLRGAGQRLESGPLEAQRAALETELGLHAEARRSIERVAALSPIVEKDLARWLAARRADTAYLCGDVESAAAHAAKAEGPFYRRLAERLAKPDPAAKRVLLDVAFVRQHHMTCAPATLTALAKVWSMPAEHLAVAEEICYDGTPASSERRWAEENGWAVREFTLTRESARGLLDRGIPFTLTTVDPGNAHLQALIGYDDRRGSFLVRDPFERNWGEFDQEELLKHYRSSGPRGMAMVPLAKAELFDGLELPEAEFYDELHALQRSLEMHDRAGAQGRADALAARAPGGRLALLARRALAAYDADRAGLLSTTEALLRLYPDDANLELARLSLLRELSRRDERLEALRRLSEGESSHPIFWPQYAQELAVDARREREAAALLRRTLRFNPRDAGSHRALAQLEWNRGRRDEALELYRFAACLEDKNEDYAASYFIACRHLRRTADAVLLLRNRARRFGKASASPARTLFWALEQLDRTREAFEALEDALRERPDDADLLLYAADARARYGEPERAAALLEAARGKSRPAAHLRAAAQLAVYRGDLKAARELWGAVLTGEPLAMDAHAATARLLAETEGKPAALEHLRAACARFPHHAALHALRIEWLREADPAEMEAALRHLLVVNPADAWARRELALFLSRQGRHEEAVRESEEGERLEPTSPAAGWTKARVLGRAGRPAEAREACRTSIRLSVDFEPAIGELMSLCPSAAERRRELGFLHAELARQVIFGDGLLMYRTVARDTLEPAELLAALREGHAARPDLWQAWSALTQQCAELDRLDEALELAAGAVERFPLLPPLWLDLAYVRTLRGEGKEELEALEQAFRINPGWAPAVRELASAHERRGDYARSREIYEGASARAPLEAAHHGGLAWSLWRLGKREEALGRVERAVQLDPAFDWAWGMVLEWSRELGRPERPGELARELSGRRGGESRAWFVLARVLQGPEHLEERLKALDRACTLEPRWTDPRDVKAALLSDAGRYDEALAVCGWVAPGESRPPLELRGRAAWIEGRRGNLAGALAGMKAAVAEDPSYGWGWRQLADWHRDAGDAAEFLEAARQVARIYPQSAVAFGTLGEARLRSGDEKGAETDFARAFELAPDAPAAGLSLFDLRLKRGDVDGAAGALAVLKTHAEGPDVLSREVRLLARQAKRDEALLAFEGLCAGTGVERGPLDEALAALSKAGTGLVAERRMLDVLRRPGTKEVVAASWAAALAARAAWPSLREGIDLLKGTGTWAAAAGSYLEAAAEAGRGADVRAFLRANGEELRRDVGAWGSAAYAWRRLGDCAKAVAWTAEPRGDARPWMLMNRAEALAGLGRFEEVGTTARTALGLTPDHTSHLLRLWEGFAAGLGGDAARARRSAEQVDPDPLGPYYRSLHSLVRAVGADSFRFARERLSRAAAGLPAAARDAVWGRAYRAAAARVAAAWGRPWWGLWRRWVVG